MSRRTETQRELAHLRARVADLEGQLEAQTRATNAIVAQAEEKLYWLERWHIDLDRVMQRPAAQMALDALKPVRAVYRVLRRLSRRLTGPT